MSKQLDRITAAVITMINDKSHVFYAWLLMNLTRVEDASVGTMGVGLKDGRVYLYYSPAFIDKLTHSELCAVMEHEVLHLVLEHPTRERGRKHMVWNMGCDVAINTMIEGLPKDCMYPTQFKFPDGKSAEWYYSELMKTAITADLTDLCPDDAPMPCPKGFEGKAEVIPMTPEASKKMKNKPKRTGSCAKDCKYYQTPLCPAKGGGQGQGDGNGNGQGDKKGNGKGKGNSSAGDHDHWKEFADGDANLNREGVRQIIKDAYEQTSKSRGHVPGNIESQIKKWLAPPTLSWKQLLRMFVAQSIKCGSKRTWKRPNRRYGDKQKGRLPERTLKLAIAIDTSGSVGTEDFKEFMAEIRSIQSCYRQDTVVIEADAEVAKTYKLKPHHQLDVNFRGRGGTDYEPVFKYIKEKERDTDLLIYFTDFYCSFPKEKPKHPVIWVVTSQGDKSNTPPWGMIARIKPKKGRYDDDE